MENNGQNLGGIEKHGLGGGIEKHGLGGAIEREADKAGRSVDGALGSPSHLMSSEPAKRKAAENELKDLAHAVTGGVAYPGDSALENEVVVDESLKALVLAYLDENSEILGEYTVDDINIVIGKTGDADIDVAASVLTFGNAEVNSFVKSWVMEHIVEEASVEELREIAAAYLVEHSSETDVALAIGTGGEAVSTLAPALFDTNHPELSADVATHLLGAEVVDTVE